MSPAAPRTPAEEPYINLASASSAPDDAHLPSFAALAAVIANDGAAATPSGASSKRTISRGEGEDKIKRTRQSQSCDACRARKVKCDRLPPSSGDLHSLTRDVCTHCHQLGLACTFDYKQKKRGPPNLFVKRLHQTAGSPAAVFTNSDNPAIPLDARSKPRSPIQSGYSESFSPGHDHWLGGQTTRREIKAPFLITPDPYHLGQHSDLGRPGSAIMAPQHPGRISMLAEEEIGYAARALRADDRSWDKGMFSVPNTARHPPRDPTSMSQSSPEQGLYANRTGRTPYPSLSSYTSVPPSSFNPLERVLPRSMLRHIIGLYFDYVYGLIPCVHRPTFEADLADHREEKPGQEEWTILVLALVAVTLVQVPASFVIITRKEAKELVQRCYAETHGYLCSDYNLVTSQRCVILYLHLFVASLLDKNAVGETLRGTLWASMLQLQLDEEATYTKLPPLQEQLCRRVYWLAYGGDRTSFSMDGVTVLGSEDDCGDVGLPAVIDDHDIKETGYSTRSEPGTPLLSGFYYISKLFRILGQVLDKRRRDRRRPPNGPQLQLRLDEIDHLFGQIVTLMDDCPEELRLDWNDSSEAVNGISDDWEKDASADLKQLFLNPKANKAVVKDAFLVQQANIYVTQQMARLLTLQYRTELWLLQQAELRRGNSRPPEIPTKDPRFTDDVKDEIACDLLAILRKIPIQVIAVNSMPLVTKVRFVASTLLEALETPDDVSERRQKAQTYLLDFLRILSQFEALCSMTEGENTAG